MNMAELFVTDLLYFLRQHSVWAGLFEDDNQMKLFWCHNII